MVGITDGEISAIKLLELDSFSTAERAMLEFVRVTVERQRASDEHFEDLRKELSDREVIELQLVVGVYCGLAAVMVGLDLELDAESGAKQLTRDERGPRLGS